MTDRERAEAVVEGLCCDCDRRIPSLRPIGDGLARCDDCGQLWKWTDVEEPGMEWAFEWVRVD